MPFSCHKRFGRNYYRTGLGALFSQAFFLALIAGPFPMQAARLVNISTRIAVKTGDNVAIAGFIVTGTESKKVIIRGIGPSLTAFGVPGALQDPTLELHDAGGTIRSNDNWKDTQQAEIQATGIPPTNDLESAIVMTLNPGAYTAILAGKNAGTGVGLVEVYDLATAANSKLANISTRGFVDTGDNVMIGGLIVGAGTGGGTARVIVRALGPSLGGVGVSGALQDPTLELRGENGVLVASNDNWRDTQNAEIQETGIQPPNDFESAIVQTLAPGAYTAILAGNGGRTGVGLVEVYDLRKVLVLASGLTFNDGLADGRTTGSAVGKVVTDSDTLFWFDYTRAGGVNGGSIKSVPKMGGTVTTLAGGLSGVNGLVSDGERVFWTEFDIGSGDGSIKSVAKTSGVVQVLATGFFPLGIAVDTDFVYWGEQLGGGAVRRVAKTGGVVTDFGRGLGFSGALNDGTYFYEVSNQQVWRMPMTGGSVDVLANYTSNNPASALLDATSIYWVELTAPNGKINSVPKVGGAVTTLLSGLRNPHSVAVDESYAYYISPGQMANYNTISRLPKTGGATEAFYPLDAVAIGPPTYLAVDSGFVYSSLFNPQTSGQGKVVSISK